MIRIYKMWDLIPETNTNTANVTSWTDGSVDVVFSFEKDKRATITLTKEAIERIYTASQEAQQ
jgi:hypothetical protein